MRIEVTCTTCKTPHFDHYECSKCHAHLPMGWYDYYDLKNGVWQYCPWCGEPLVDLEVKKKNPDIFRDFDK